MVTIKAALDWFGWSKDLWELLSGWARMSTGQ